jgi:hypothetical protein
MNVLAAQRTNFPYFYKTVILTPFVILTIPVILTVILTGGVMDKPLCKVCFKKHYTHEGHIFPDVVKVETAPILDVYPNPKTGKVDHGSPVRKWDKESWNAYMKEYMKAYRKKEKQHE